MIRFAGSPDAVFAQVALAGLPLPKHGAFLTAAPLLELMLGIAMLAIASMTAGLLISAVVNSSDTTIPPMRASAGQSH